MLDLRVSEGLGKLAGATRGSLVSRAAKYASDSLQKNRQSNGLVFSATPKASEGSMTGGKSFQQAAQESNAKTGYTGAVLPNVGSGSKFDTALANRKNEAAANAIGRDWDNADDVRKTAGGSLKGLKSLIETGFGSAREKYLRANDANLQAKKDAIAGNRELVTKNQTKDLGELASGMRKSIFNTNLSLGAAAGSSASQAASRALTNAAGKNRANILTGYGDQISQENQNENNATEYYKVNRDKVYEWEKQQKEQAIRSYNEQKRVYDRLKEKAPSWKQADIEAESNGKLQELLAGLGGISANARAYRDQLNNTILSLVDQAQGLRTENIGIDRPAELDTPEFSEQLDPGFLEGEDTYGESFYNPNLKLKKREGSDLFDNPLVFE